MQIEQTKIADLLIIQPKVFGDNRGFFCETWHKERYAELGITNFVQDNLSMSSKNVLRGLHLQNPRGQGKLVSVLLGEIFDVAVDVRYGSPTFGEWVGVKLNSELKNQFWLPPGFAHGFCVLSDLAYVYYKCTENVYSPKDELGIAWNDPALNINWATDSPILSDKDKVYPCLKNIKIERLAKYK